MDFCGWDILTFIVISIFSYVGCKLKVKYDDVIDTKEKKETCEIVVKAVEQIAKTNNWNGEQKKNEAVSYVVKLLKKKGISIDIEEINLMIEAAVNGLSKGINKAETNTTNSKYTTELLDVLKGDAE